MLTGISSRLRRCLADCRIGFATSVTDPSDRFAARHIGPNADDSKEMLKFLGFDSMEKFMNKVVPEEIRLKKKLKLSEPKTESEALNWMKKIVSKNIVTRSFIGMGYNETITPGVILRNMLENPGWYTAYTPYQAEVSQGRLEMLLNFQTMVCDLTKMAICNASLLDEGTAAAEAMHMCLSINGESKRKFVVLNSVWKHTTDVVHTRCRALGIELVITPISGLSNVLQKQDVCGVLIQSPSSMGEILDISELQRLISAKSAMTVVATDLLALTLIQPPGEYGVDIVVGSAQRFGVPLNYGGPHAGFLSTTTKHARKMPGRLIGVTQDSNGNAALRMAMQTREQHIRRGGATSNICTAQALLANMAASYAIYHGPAGLDKIARRIHGLAVLAEAALKKYSFYLAPKLRNSSYFDTIVVETINDVGYNYTQSVFARALAKKLSVRLVDDIHIGISIGEMTTKRDLLTLINCFVLATNGPKMKMTELLQLDDSLNAKSDSMKIKPLNQRSSPILTHAVFNSHHSETQMLRYLKRLENKDVALNTSMISLGSCTMKLNATSEMIPVTWPKVCDIHPFAHSSTTRGYKELVDTLHKQLMEITGFAAASCQPNSGAQGEFAGLMCIRQYQKANDNGHRDICLIPVSAHGTNPASAVMAGLKVVVVKSDDQGRIDMEDLNAKINEHKDNLAVLMVTYPSTFGVFEKGIVSAIKSVHDAGGQVYMDGANMNAQVGFTSPATMGADVCHLNLHKTFCIPHGGGGPGVGTVCVAEHLAEYVPGHVARGGSNAVSSAPDGSAAILPIPLMYISMLGADGLEQATAHAVMNANYMAKKLESHYSILYRDDGFCAHEFIIDLRPFKSIGVTEEDVAKRLQDYGFHSPTMSWPVPGTLMVEPTESEDKAELDRFIDAMVTIRGEIAQVAEGKLTAEESPLHHAPHTQSIVTADSWTRKYTRQEAAFPRDWIRGRKFWPTVGRVDNVFGDRNLVCSCPPTSSYGEQVPVPIMAALSSSSSKSKAI